MKTQDRERVTTEDGDDVGAETTTAMRRAQRDPDVSDPVVKIDVPQECLTGQLAVGESLDREHCGSVAGLGHGVGRSLAGSDRTPGSRIGARTRSDVFVEF